MKIWTLLDCKLLSILLLSSYFLSGHANASPNGASVIADNTGSCAVSFSPYPKYTVETSPLAVFASTQNGISSVVFQYGINFNGEPAYQDTGKSVRTTCTEAIDYKFLPPEFKKFHQQRADETSFISEAADTLGLSLGCLGSNIYSCLDAVGASILSNEGGPIVGGLIGLAVGASAIFTGSAVAAVGGSVAIVGSFANYMSQTHQMLANDPPDPNFLNVVEYSGHLEQINTGMGLIADSYISDTFNALSLAAESSNNELISLERYQGAILSEDYEAAINQLMALIAFGDGFSASSLEAASFLAGLDELLEFLLVEDVINEDGQSAFALFESFALLLADGRDFQSAFNEEYKASVVPVPAAVWLFGSGLVGLIAIGRRKKAA